MALDGVRAPIRSQPFAKRGSQYPSPGGVGGEGGIGWSAEWQRYFTQLDLLLEKWNRVSIGVGAQANGINAIAIGRDAVSSAQSSIAIGVSSVASALTSVVIGAAAQSNAATSVVIGDNAQITNALRTASVTIGASAAGVQNGVIIGASASSTGASAIVIGASAIGARDSVTIGYQANAAGFFPVVTIGEGATATANNQCVIGGTTYPITDFYLGRGVVDASPSSITINANGGSGSNIAGGQLSLSGGRGTGTGLGGPVVLRTAPAGASGSALNALVDGAKLDTNSIFGLLCSQRVTSQFDKTNATLAAITGLSVTVTAAKKYSFLIVLHMQESTTGGIQFDFNGGSATMTDLIADVEVTGVSGAGTSIDVYRASALTSAYSLDDGSGNYRAVIRGTFLVNAGGTFAPRFAQNDAAGTSSVLVGSMMEVIEML